MLISDGSLTTNAARKHMLSAWLIALFTAILSLTVARYDGDKHMCPRDFGDGGLGPNDSGVNVSPISRSWSVGGSLIQANLDRRVSLQADFEDSDAYTVFFDMSVENNGLGGINDTGGRPINCEAIIQWMVAGNQVQRKVSVGPGVSD